jgi:hypothetical protein
MSYVTQTTTWLSDDISHNVKNLIARFYELADSKAADAGRLMATDVFSTDGVFVSPSGTFRGFEGSDSLFGLSSFILKTPS